jgi:hypothetical protein
MSKSNDLSKKILDHMLGGPDYTRPATVYIALFTADPGEGSGGTEATGSGYARKAVTNNDTNFPASTGSTTAAKTNGADITFDDATGDWSSGADMTHWVMFDASSGGNRMYKGALTTAKPVLSGDGPVIKAGDMDITED